MNRFSRIRHHVSVEDVKKKHLESIAVENFIRTEEEISKTISEKFKHNWRKELEEGMTTSNALSTVLPAEGEVAIDQVSPVDSASFADTNNMFGSNADNPALVDATIRASGSGTGSNNGFNVGGDYLAFQGGSGSSRMALLKPMDATKVDTLTITAIRGTGSNGGEHPDVVGTEELFVIYKTPEMSRSSYLSQDRSQNNIGAFPADASIIAIDQGDGTLQNYSITIPEYARQKDVIFGLFQLGNSGSQYDHYGVTDIKFQRKTPINVVVPLDSPEAISFVRVGTNEGDPKKRKKKINDQLAASDEYTSQQMGGEFPGQGARIDGEDPFKSAEVQDVAAPSPLGKPAVTKSFADFQKGQEKVEVLKTPEQIKAQNDEYLADLDKLLTQNDYDYSDPKIIEIADKILKTDPKNIDAYFYKLGAQYETGDMKAVLKTTDAMIKNNPDDPTGYELRSFTKKQEGDLAGAIEDLEKAIELDPESEYIAYTEMELADLKYQEAEVETNNAIRDRMESEAAAIQEKGHKDYWGNADFLDQEQEELAEYQYVSDEQLLRDFQGFDNFYGNPRNTGRSDEVPSMLRAAQTFASQLEHTDKFDGDKYQAIINAAQSWEGTETEWVKFYTDAYMRIVYPDGDSRTYNWIYNNAMNGMKGGGGVSVFGTPAGVLGQYKLSKVDEMSPQEVVREFKRFMSVWYNTSRSQNIIARSKSANLNNLAPYLNALARKLPDDYFETDSEEPINTLYDQMKALYDEKDPEKEIKTELRANSDLNFEKQYKDLMTAWDSADKFSKFITPLKNLSDALLGSKTAQNAKYENYKIAIAKSIMLNKPIRVNPDTIDPLLIKKLGSRITPNQILSYDEEQRFKKTQEAYAKLVKQGKGDPSLLYDYDQPLATDGIPLIPIVSEPVPYADENIYEDEFGRVFTNDGSVDNTTLQPDRAYHGFASAYKAEILGTNPLAGRGQAQYQIVVPPDGSEPYLLYKDHAYHNVKSADEGEVPGFMNKGAAGFVNWLGNTAHARSDGDANTAGMAGYPPNIRGDVITEFRIPIADLSKQVQESVYRHKMMTENPDLVQVLRDYFYTEDKVKTFNIGGKDAKGLHNLYTNVILKRADQLKDFITDNRVELVLRGIGKITGAEDVGNITTASNMLQRYDDYIQQTIYTSDGRAYIPGVTTPDGNVISRININDQFTKGSQNKLQSLMSDEEIQALVKRYVDMGKTEEGKKQLGEFLNLHIGDKGKLGFALSNSLGGGAQIDIDEFLNGRLVIKKNYEFRHDESIDKVGVEYDLSKGLLGLFGVEKKGTLPIAKTMANLFDVSNDAWAHHDNIAIATLASVATMGAARQLLRPVRNQGQSFAEAMNVAPTMPYKLEFDVSEKIMKILQGIEDKSREEEDLGVSATDAATLAALNKKKKKNNVKESTLFERVKSKQFFNPKDIKPTFPENPPPEIDKKTGMHPNYGKQAKRYNKLDPISANSMPPTGDPEIDAVVDKQRTKKKPSERKQDYIKTVSKIKKMTKGG